MVYGGITELFKVIITVAQALTAVFAAVIAANSFRIARRSLEQTEQNVYLKLYELVQKHHSKEITDLRGCLYTQDNKSKLSEVVAVARANGKSLKEHDGAFHAQVSALTNYYESVGMFLQFGWEKMPSTSKTMMLAMLHNSVTKTWREIDSYKDAIYPNQRPRDWAQSFQWLYARVDEYQREQNLA